MDHAGVNLAGKHPSSRKRDMVSNDIYPPPSAASQKPHLSIVGGGGTYSAVGARLLSPPPLSRSVGWIVDAGTDFPHDQRAIIDSWQTGVLLRERNGLTTKGWNGYGANDHRAFKYLTPKLRLAAGDLSPELLLAKSFHLICAPSRASELVDAVLTRRHAQDPSSLRPIFIWEPVPDLCVPDELERAIQAAQKVDVISPNHVELSSFFGSNGLDGNGQMNFNELEKFAEKFAVDGDGRAHGVTVVVRAGKDGCYVRSKSQKQWLPAYYGNHPEKVVDPTGGGNGFLGGFAAGLVRTSDPVTAAIWGSVSASFCIEQVGVPTLQPGEHEEECWNGVQVNRRLAEFEALCRNS